MFNWLKRRLELATTRAATEDIDRFLLSLKRVSDQEMATVVAFATHWRRFLRQQNIDMLEPVRAERRNPAAASVVNRLVKEAWKVNPAMATGALVWLHTIRAANIPEVRVKGREMWGELRRGFAGAELAAEDYEMRTGIKLDLGEHPAVPRGLEPVLS